MMHTSLEQVEFVIFDTETTGLDPRSGDRVVELAALRLKADQSLDVFESLVNPRHPISAGAFAVNKITPEMLAQAPSIEEVLPRFVSFIGSGVVCSYNLAFDLGFLNAELERMGGSLPPSLVMVDILAMARTLMPRLQRHALWFVAEHIGIKLKQEHRAFADVEMARDVFLFLLRLLRDKGIEDLGQFLSLFSFKACVLEDAQEQKIAEIQEAIDLGLALEIKYFSRSTADVSARTVRPKEIFTGRGAAYLTAFCVLRNEERTFRIDHILAIKTLKV